MKATKVDAIKVNEFGTIQGIQWFTTDCHDYDAFLSLPKACDLGGTVYALTGWNSDRNVAYFQSNQKFARPLT